MYQRKTCSECHESLLFDSRIAAQRRVAVYINLPSIVTKHLFPFKHTPTVVRDRTFILFVTYKERSAHKNE